MIATFNVFHLGDQILHLHFLRKVCGERPDFEVKHHCATEHHAQLAPMIADLPRIKLCDMSSLLAAPRVVNAWRGAGGFWYSHPASHDFVAASIDWFSSLAEQMGVRNPIRCAEDFLLDYPALRPGITTQEDLILVNNAKPLSGQARNFDADQFDDLIAALLEYGHSVVATNPTKIPDVPCTRASHLDVTAVGKLSCRCLAVVGVCNGPMWQTMNIWNKDSVKFRALLSDREQINICKNTHHCDTVRKMHNLLKDHGYI